MNETETMTETITPRRRTFLLGSATALALPPVAARADQRQPATKDPVKEAKDDYALDRAQVQAIIADGFRIVTPDGVDDQLEIDIGGIKQAISVRGRDRANPILLMIHGGPASPEIPTSWAFQSGWEDYFTVVQWDQRGAGKTYVANDPKVMGPTLSLDRIVADAAELVDWLMARYGKSKVFVLGHSWGSVVGLTLAHRHPEKLFAYVGMGQVTNGVASERASYQGLLRLAKAGNNSQAVNELEAIAPYPEADGAVPLAKVNIERKWIMALGGLSYRRAKLGWYLDLAELSPDYSSADLDAIDKGSALSLAPLLPAMTGFDYTGVTHFDCPIVMFCGRHDLTTPPEVTAAWFDTLMAPHKLLFWFENSAHMIMMEEPGKVLVHLATDVRALA